MKKLTILFVVVSLLIYTSAVYADPPYIQMFRALPQASGQVMFIGDSITEGCEWHELFNVYIQNRGIGGTHTLHWTVWIDEVIQQQIPAKVFIALGINNILFSNIDRFYVEYKYIIQRIRYFDANANIYLVSILPMNYTMPGRLCDTDHNATIHSLNTILQGLAIEMSCEYIDLHSQMHGTDRWQLDANYSIDGVHLNQSGYQAWKYMFEWAGYLQ